MGALPPDTRTLRTVFQTDILRKAEKAPRLILRGFVCVSMSEFTDPGSCTVSWIGPIAPFLLKFEDDMEFFPFITFFDNIFEFVSFSFIRTLLVVVVGSTISFLLFPPNPPIKLLLLILNLFLLISLSEYDSDKDLST